MNLKIKLELIVLKSHEIEIIKSFYENIGISFLKEKHGNGIEHYSSLNIEPAIEIYPSNKNEKNHICLFLKVKNIESYVDMYLKKNKIKYEVVGNRVYLRDPDDNRIEVSS